MGMNTGTKINKEEQKLKYLEITDEILDGVFPDEEIRKLKRTNKKESFIIDIYGRPQLVNDVKDQIEDNISDKRNVIKRKQEKSTIYETLHLITNVLTPYANIHISILFIIVLSLLSCIFINSISIIISILFVISLIRLDQKYHFGLAIFDNELVA